MIQKSEWVRGDKYISTQKSLSFWHFLLWDLMFLTLVRDIMHNTPFLWKGYSFFDAFFTYYILPNLLLWLSWWKYPSMTGYICSLSRSNGVPCPGCGSILTPMIGYRIMTLDEAINSTYGADLSKPINVWSPFFIAN